MLEVKLKIDSKYISDNPGPHKQVLKNNMVHESEVLCITIADNKLSIPYTVNHLTKSISGEETAKEMSNQAIQTHVCLHHLKNRLINIDNSVIKDTIKCLRLVKAVQNEIQCEIVVSKRVYSQINPVLKPCSYCFCNELKCIKLAVLGISMVSESRNQTAQLGPGGGGTS